MRTRTRLAVWIGCIATGLLSARPGVAQSPLNSAPYPLPPKDRPSATNPALLPLTEDLGVLAAIEKARRTKRLLLIFWSADTPDNPSWTFCRSSRSLSLRAYIKWHCVAIQARTLPPGMANEVCKRVRDEDLTLPAVILVRDGEVEKVIAVQRMGQLGYVTPRAERCSADADAYPCGTKQFVPGPLMVLFQTDFAMDRLRARDPVWVGLHEAANPAPQPPPEGEPLCTTADDRVMTVRDPRPEEKIGPLDRLAEARAAMRSGDIGRATGLYSWLWERGEAADPAFRGARLSAVAQDIAELVGKGKVALERFEKIRAVRTERMAWAEFGQMHEWFVLSGATGRSDETVDYLDYFINDLDEGSISPRTDYTAMKMLARREDFSKAWQTPPAGTSPTARVAMIAGKMNPKFPTTVTEAAAAEYRAFVGQFLIDEGSRLYAACLLKGDEAGAAEVARTVLAARNDAAARLALITTALSAEPAQARPVHLEWLAQAEAATGKKRDDLRTRIELGTGGMKP